MPADRPEGSQGTYGADVYVQDGVVYPDEATAVVMRHPNIPDDLKRVYITKPDDKEDTTSSTMPLGSTGKLTGALELQPGTGVPLTEITSPEPSQGLVIPEPYGLNPPERGPGFEGPPRPPAKVLFKTSTGVEFTDHDIEDAINIASSFGTGTMAGVKSARNMNKLSDLGHAQVLESAGEHPDTVHKETGFFRGADSRWRYEIDDSKSNLKSAWSNEARAEGKEVTLPLSEVLDHPDLYKAYPHLKDVQVKYDPDYKGIASWNNSNTVTMGPRAFTSNNPHSILMHEIQHAVQSEEGFAKGGAAGKSGTDFELKHSKAVRDLIPEMKELRNKAEEGTTTPAEDARLAWFHEIAETYSKYAEAGDVKAFENYLKLAGETESRNVEARLFMSEEARRRVPPRKTEDYTPREQIIRSVPEMTTAYTRQYK